MQQHRIRLFADNAHFADEKFDRFTPLVHQPNTHRGKIFSACILIPFGLFLMSLTIEQGWLTCIMLMTTLSLPLAVFWWLERNILPDRTEAYVDPEGLLLKVECGRFPELNTDIRIPFVEIESITLESKEVYEGRLGTHRWRQYRIKTCRSGEFPHLLINTFRPLHLVMNDLKRLVPLLPQRIDIHLIGTSSEMAACST
ncbi:hypothetical protein [Pseudomonas sp. GOM6]|uniref:hypothetical protein n=1 Tax=Pseudomonas sp. GOM6 TaxID=3036944 RepID=UPI002409649B|nr:hypothetical protein [Pseudomonas sp. GOM6]MDG1579885.1 hypothetical protein [Pseudomonas sp. GOM6]